MPVWPWTLEDDVLDISSKMCRTLFIIVVWCVATVGPTCRCPQAVMLWEVLKSLLRSTYTLNWKIFIMSTMYYCSTGLGIQVITCSSDFSGCIQVQLQETSSVRRSNTEYPGKTACCTRQQHWDSSMNSYHLHNVFPGAPSDRRSGACDGCRMRFVNSWALGWSRDM